MLEEYKKIGVFIKRDFKILFTYRLAFSAMFLNMIFNLFYFILFGSMFGGDTPSHLAPYEQDFIAYLLVGSMGWSFLWSVMSASSSALRKEMMMGTLESILLSSTKFSTLIMAYTVFGCFMGGLSIAIIMTVGYVIFGVTIAANLYTLMAFILSTVMMAGFGIMFSGLTLWMKNIGNTIPVVQNVAMFFSGVYFPITVLPAFLQEAARYVPFYYAIEGIRVTLVEPNEATYYVLRLLLFTVIFLILGVYTLDRGMKKAKQDGSLSFY